MAHGEAGLDWTGENVGRVHAEGAFKKSGNRSVKVGKP